MRPTHSGTPVSTAIPQLIHLEWFGSTLKSSGLNSYETLYEWCKLNPDFKVKLWHNGNIKEKDFPATKPPNISLHNITELNFFGKNHHAFDLHHHASVQMFSACGDIAKANILLQHGGWHFDFGIQPKKINQHDAPFGFLFKGSDPCILAAAARHPFFFRCCEILDITHSMPGITASNLTRLARNERISLIYTLTGDVFKYAYNEYFPLSIDESYATHPTPDFCDRSPERYLFRIGYTQSPLLRSLSTPISIYFERTPHPRKIAEWEPIDKEQLEKALSKGSTSSRSSNSASFFSWKALATTTAIVAGTAAIIYIRRKR